MNKEPIHSLKRNDHGPQGLRVFLVEDDADAAEMLAAVLRIYGHEVCIFSDGPTALQAVQAETPDVVLLDIGLPGMNGYEMAEKLRQSKTAKRPLLIALTGRSQKEERLRSYQVGIDLHLTKPVGGEELQSFLERYQTMVTPRRSPPLSESGT